MTLSKRLFRRPSALSRAHRSVVALCLFAPLVLLAGCPKVDDDRNGPTNGNGGEPHNGNGDPSENEEDDPVSDRRKSPPRCGTPDEGGPVGWVGSMVPPESHPAAFDAPAPPLEISAQVWAEGVTESPGPAEGLVAELWTNIGGLCEGIPMEYSGREGNNHVFRGELPAPEGKGVFRYRVRAGEPGAWRYGPSSLLLVSPLEGLAKILEGRPPDPEAPLDPHRELALKDLDAVLLSHYFTGHGGFLDVREPGGRVHRYVTSRAHALLDLLREPFPDDGARAEIFSLYNMGVVARTAEATVGVDITLPSDENEYDMGWDPDPDFDAVMAAELDLLLLSHHHTDHADRSLMEAMIAAGKPVLAPAYLAAAVPGVEAMPTEATTRIYEDVRVESFPGPHVYDHVLDRVTDHRHYKVTFPSGLVLVHTGDLDYTQGTPLSQGAIDVLVIKAAGVCPLYDPHQPGSIGDHCDGLMAALEASRPNLAIPSHLMELGHPIGGGRYGYSVALDCANRLASHLPEVKVEVLAPGDRLVYSP